MDNKVSEKGIAFKDFLDKTTNLVTLFGVFNALFIYSSTIEIKGAAQFLLPSFFLLSMLVWLELILFTMSSNDGSAKYTIFYFLFCSVEIGLVYFFVAKFSVILVQLGVIGLLFLLAIAFTYFVIRLLAKWLRRSNVTRRETYIYLILVLGVIVSGFLLNFASPLLKPVIDKTSNKKEVKSDSSGIKMKQ